ncbi:hypothetical protein [Janthinobacterium violaceinigrum]|uniref:hypothetical protein n=1 Tax=Janthinobacterium violaceinigrum TaxID=2654252 RepID=UPI001D0264B8|nr:hypothetical protein [Janthinobacterium violaceinigrum]
MQINLRIDQRCPFHVELPTRNDMALLITRIAGANRHIATRQQFRRIGIHHGFCTRGTCQPVDGVLFLYYPICINNLTTYTSKALVLFTREQAPVLYDTYSPAIERLDPEMRI